MKDPLQRLRALSREKQSLLSMWLRAERGAVAQASVQETTALTSQERVSGAKRLPGNLPSPEELEGLSNEEVDSLLSEMLAAEASADLTQLPPGTADAYAAKSAEPVPDTSSMSDEEVAAMLAELLEQEETR
jgi:hypothetical protein